MPEAHECHSVNKRLCDFFPPQQKVIAFFINQLVVSPDVWMRVLAEEAKLLGYGTVGLLTEQSRDANLDTVDMLLTVAPDDIRHLERIDLFCVTVLSVLYIPRPRACFPLPMPVHSGAGRPMRPPPSRISSISTAMP